MKGNFEGATAGDWQSWNVGKIKGPKFENEQELRDRYEKMFIELAKETARCAREDTEAFRFLVYSMIRIISEGCRISQRKTRAE